MIYTPAGGIQGASAAVPVVAPHHWWTAAPQGSRVTIGASGPQAEAAVAAIAGLVESGFGEVYG